jgi:Na+-transporting NADH:ubiquinone oxidoreductase subunit A
MGKKISLKKGFNLSLLGEAEKQINEIDPDELFGFKPTDFESINPKLIVKEGDKVKAGQALFFDKNHPDIKFPSTVSGKVLEILRGPKRIVLAIKILSDKKQVFEKCKFSGKLTKENVQKFLLETNLWWIIQQRPFGCIANPNDTPKGIFISGFDSSPLAPDLSYLIQGNQEAFNKGLEMIHALADGNLHIGAKKDTEALFKLGEIHEFSGPHPSGNVGIQIHHISPVMPGQLAWTVDVQNILLLGNILINGEFNTERIIPITGSQVNNPEYLKLKIGQSLASIYNRYTQRDENRYIQGNVLTGKSSSEDDFLSYHSKQLTIIPEGRYKEFMGWVLPSFEKLSLSKTLFSWILKNKKFKVDTNTHGEQRPFVVSGQYEKVLPMNIMPVQLLKAILAKDIEKMEALGITEVIEEDLALCEFVCSSKIDVQKILREGLDLLKSES